MKRIITILIFCSSLCMADGFNRFLKPLFDRHCNSCHGKEKTKGKVNLYELRSLDHLRAQPKLIKNIIEVIESNDMPPEDELQLNEKHKTSLVKGLKILLKSSLSLSKPAAPQQRRMNRFQYNNTVKDLLDLKIDLFPLPEKMLNRHSKYFTQDKMPPIVHVSFNAVKPKNGMAGIESFPQDLRALHGFDNQADQLTLTPVLLDSFLKLSMSIVESNDFNSENVGIWKDFFEKPEGNFKDELQRRMSSFLLKAFRTPVDKFTLNRYINFVELNIKNGLSYTESMKKVVSAVLASPMFLLIYDSPSPSMKQYNLASRLSFFLWGSSPDNELMSKALAGDLNKPDVLRKTVYQMLSNDKIERFLDSFPQQWLQLEAILTAVPDPEKYPIYYFQNGLNASSQLAVEPLILFDAVFTENMPIVQLINPSFSYRSEFLNKWYAAKNFNPEKKSELNNLIETKEFKKVTLKDNIYGGIITNAAVMTMTSAPLRTQPISRGAWITEAVFNDPPPPPPNNVPPLDEENENKDQTIREKFAEHRKNPDCAGCHTRLDPLGFALENFNVIGHWRIKYENDRSIDPSGIMMKEFEFNNVTQFKEILVKNQKRIAKALAAHLLRYALARELSPTETIIIDDIVNKTEKNGFKLKDIIVEIVLSESFNN